MRSIVGAASHVGSGAPGFIRVESVPLRWVLRLIDISDAGVLVCGPTPLPIDKPLDLCFSRADGTWSTTLTTRVVSSHGRHAPGVGHQEYVSGLAFTSLHNELVRKRVGELLAVIGEAAVKA